MKKTLTAILAFCLCIAAWSAPGRRGGCAVPPIVERNVVKNGTMMEFALKFDISGLSVRSDRAVLLSPVIVKGSDSLMLSSIGIYGRERYIHYWRMCPSGMLGGLLGRELSETSYKASKAPDIVEYNCIVPFEKWMDGADIYVRRDDYGCCLTLVDNARQGAGQYFGPVDFSPAMYYVRPKGEELKIRELRGTAWIQFPVDETKVYPNRFDNPRELAKIYGTIDSVKTDKDIAIIRLSLKGFASPESPYAHNEYLAKNRTLAVAEYIRNRYDFPDSVLACSHVPEDWEGLRAQVEGSGLEHRKEILEIIDSKAYGPDERERKIMQDYRREYEYMLNEWYPRLRRTEYVIDYRIRSFIDAEEIKRLIGTKPQNLSLNEFYIAASASSDEEVGEIWETAVRMYPESDIANANAATSALVRRDLKGAERYLAKAGTLPEAEYGRGVLAVYKDRYDDAEVHFQKAAKGGIDVSEAMAQLKLVRERGLERN